MSQATMPCVPLWTGDGRVPVDHKGDLSWRDFPGLAGRVKAYLSGERLDRSRYHRAYSVFIEMAYNVLNHGLATEPRRGESVRRVPAHVVVGRREGLVWIASSNLVSASDASGLEPRLRSLRGLGPERLRAQYREQLTRGPELAPGPAPGGGLGLLTIARDAARPLQFSIAPADPSGIAVFNLEVLV